jgi:hypothetical protein
MSVAVEDRPLRAVGGIKALRAAEEQGSTGPADGARSRAGQDPDEGVKAGGIAGLEAAAREKLIKKKENHPR